MSSGENQSNNSPAKGKLTPDPDNSFFRSWALRTRESTHSSVSDVSPGNTTPISPKNTSRSRPRRRPSLESSSTHCNVQNDESDAGRRSTVVHRPALAQNSSSTAAARERRQTRTRGSLDSLASRGSSNASSVARRTLRLLKVPTLAGPPTSSSEHKPKNRSGHWLDIRVGKKGAHDVASLDPDNVGTPHASYLTPSPASLPTPKAHKTTEAPKPQDSLAQGSNQSTDSSSPEGRSKKSFVDRTKRLLGIKSTTALPSLSRKVTRTPSGTKETLHRAANVLHDLVEQTQADSPGSSSTSNSAASIAGQSKRRHGHVLRPDYRRHHTGHSSSSSVRAVMLGNPPVSTPNDLCMYTGSDSQQYARVDLTLPNGPTYLPSEARRVNTPPLHDNSSKLRGFFMDYNAPRSREEEPHPGNPWPNTPMNTAPFPRRRRDLDTVPRSPAPPRSPGARMHRDNDDDGEDVNWFRHRVALGEVEDERPTFELNVPEHLPSSPLCPRHPKHKSGGKGICVYHGRNKTGPDDVVEEVEGLWR
ncbi:MAG: hypothetical protein Q9223_006882 [Gallowayella weberi]